MRRPLLPTLAVLVAGSAAAEPPARPNADDSYFEALPLVLTASRLPQPQQEAPAAVTVLDRDFIKATGYRDLARVLRLVPGMQVGQERSGHNWVTYHGLGNDDPADMQVLVDGRSIYSPSTFGGVDWLGLPVTVDEIERIEVVRGTDAVAYGPNAFLGVINIITRHSQETPGQSATVSLGDSGIRDLRFDWNGSSGYQGLRVAASSRHDDGYANLKDGSHVETISLRSDSRINDRDEVTLRLTGSQGSRGSGYRDSTFGNNAERDWQNRTSAIQAQWRHTPAADEEFLVNLYRNDDWVRDEWQAAAYPPFLVPAATAVPLNRNRQAVRHSIEIQHRFAPTAATKLVWGAEARHDRMESPFMFYGLDGLSQRLYRLFGNLEWRLNPAWTINAGGMAEKYSDDRGRLSPRLFSNWQTSPGTTLRTGYSRAWRDRNLFERYGDIRAYAPDGRLLVRPYLPNPDLRPARIDSLELGYLMRVKPGNTTVDLRIFNERITDFIVRTQQPITPDNPLLAVFMPPTQYQNLASPLTLRGVEYQIKTHPRPESEVLFSHTMVDRRTVSADVAARAAPYSASLSWREDWGGNWSSMMSLLRMGPMSGGDGFVPRFTYLAPAYTTLDARVAKRMLMGGQQVEIALSAINLGPRHQEIADRSEQFMHSEGPINPVSRMVFLSLSIGGR